MIRISVLKDNFLASIGNKKAQGAMERHNLSERLYNNYNKFIGRSGQNANIENLHIFLTKVNFNENQIEEIFINFDKENMISKIDNRTLLSIFDICSAYAMSNGLYQ